MKTQKLFEMNGCQKKAHDSIVDFWKSKRSLMTLGGFAGTGKTTLIGHVMNTIQDETKRPLRIAYCAFTGKAAAVLRRKLEAVNVLSDEDYCGTIHGLIYSPIRKGRFVEFVKVSSLDEYDLIIADEASMIDKRIAEDMLSFGVPILAVGDHGQLPPVMGKFNLMEDPDIRLEKIMRQAEGHPIVKVSMLAREEGEIPVGEYGPDVRRINGHKKFYDEDIKSDRLILCARNITRVRINSHVRRAKGFTGSKPCPGEKVICLKNNHKAGIFNGSTGKIKRVYSDRDYWYNASIDIDYGDRYLGKIFRPQFNNPKTLLEFEDLDWKEIGDLFDFGYAMTTHKAQGSEHEDVIVIEERMSFMSDDDWSRWLYTAVTRSRKKLLIIGA